MQMQAAPDYHKLQKQFTTKKLANAMVMQAANRLMNLRTLERLKAYANGEMDEEKKSEKKPEAEEKKETAKKVTKEKAESKPAKDAEKKTKEEKSTKKEADKESKVDKTAD
jgi:hypothetical protein